MISFEEFELAVQNVWNGLQDNLNDKTVDVDRIAVEHVVADILSELEGELFEGVFHDG